MNVRNADQKQLDRNKIRLRRRRRYGFAMRLEALDVQGNGLLNQLLGLFHCIPNRHATREVRNISANPGGRLLVKD